MIIEKVHIYLITYPNGKIYVGQDRTCDINYFGSACSYDIETDFKEWKDKGFSVRKKILCELNMLSIQEINAIEKQYIQKYQSNNPDIGYNRTCRPRKIKKQIIIQ